MAELRYYATADYVYFPIIDFGDTDFEDSGITFVAGDSRLIIDGVAQGNTTNVAEYVAYGMGRCLLTATELTGKKIQLVIMDQGGSPEFEDQAVNIETYGNANSQHPTASFGSSVSVSVPSAPSSASACRVYEYAFMPDGATPVSAVTAYAKIVSLPEDENGILHTGEALEAAYDSDTGILYWDIVQGAEVQFIISNFGVDTVKTVPASSTARLTDIS